MKRNISKMAGAVALALGVTSTAFAGPVTFANNGVGGGVNISSINISAGNALFNDVAPVLASSSFQMLGQAVVGTFTPLVGAAFSAAPGFEYTIVYSAPLVGTVALEAVTGRVIFNSLFDATQAPANNFFKLYYGNTVGANAHNNGAGTGFTDGTLILQGTFINANPEDATATTAVGLTNDSSGVAPKVLTSLDQSPGSPKTLTHVSTIQTVNGSAAFWIDVDETTLDLAFFPNKPNLINFNLSLGGGLKDPFPDVHPSTSFGEVVAGVIPDFGTDTVADVTPPSTPGGPGAGGQPGTNLVNNFRCNVNPLLGGPCDFIVEAQGATASVLATEVPEPASLALMGLGLGAFGAIGISRRNRRKAKAI